VKTPLELRLIIAQLLQIAAQPCHYFGVILETMDLRLNKRHGLALHDMRIAQQGS
jgi:hypothetical protein